MAEQGDKCCAATPSGDLLRDLMDSNIPKSEREWFAKGHIESLQSQLAAANERADDAQRKYETAVSMLNVEYELAEGLQKIVDAATDLLRSHAQFIQEWATAGRANVAAFLASAPVPAQPAVVPEARVNFKTDTEWFEHVIMRYGIVAACEWFGHDCDSQFTRDTKQHFAAKDAILSTTDTEGRKP